MSIFREYDIRGIFEKDLSHEVVYKIGFLLGQKILKTQDKVAIGYDARTHSPTLFKWLASGLNQSGVQVFDLGLIPTPVAYFTTFKSDIKSSIMITGSHNPPQYNGFKITINQAPFYGKDIQNLSHEMNSVKFIDESAETTKLDMLSEYVKFISDEFSALKGWSEPIAFDCGNGVAGVAMDRILQNLQLNATKLYFEPDGTFPNHHPDPSEHENLDDLKKTMKEKGIKVGIAFDGDADRVALLSPNHIFKGDELAILFAQDIAKKVKDLVVIGEVKCSQIMYDTIDKIGRAVMYKTGHSNLKVKLKELKAHLACEMSGHIFFNDRYFGYDDAIYAAFRILELIKSQESGIAALESVIKTLPKTYSTDEEKIKTTEDRKFALIESLKKKLEDYVKEQGANSVPHIKKIIDIDGVRVIFDNGWGLVRASNTTPMLVTRFEAYSKDDLATYKTFLLNLLED
ncbi:phosphomannomutase/phosphoglucomutase [Helicobacter saguini]|uniref:Phosphomannomutase/phosphoglucomutase n=1 Tax=Helicobacter saguini TaxID=1548018 RepID=A0A347VQ73_9HELI|nr:phosphomannomutase/phosphoglucomutase [Helicobacter saguini]MWV61050.1 phosphomannomutase/phosphoglucomutase [Helicobacter saguini]MWV68281.1 phosphomannomutase/phosphoglucomutase [Helicobacter saguini]MWV70254.1 phosphomannomutase/phosphoglucomutase [Helicobacter saguini]MWV72157.1 phosphomannomutase/phosphoglucomutase [Helicobacter saguini]TLD95218.1 phosphomannomutase/phosphoglucomutase [Helicobacter saguini]